MASAVYALDTLLLGHHGEIRRGTSVPATWLDTVGNEQETDFARLRDLGLVGDELAKDDQAESDEKPALAGAKKATLLEIADAEGVELEDREATNAVITEAIEKHRAASAGD